MSAGAESHDVLVVGGGPSGAACAYWLAEAGHDVAVVERKRLPREKTCGDGLTPRAVRQLEEMGLTDELSGFHRYQGLRSVGFGRSLELSWPEHPDFPSHGYVVTRYALDAVVTGAAGKAGAAVHQGVEATAPLLDGAGACRGAVVVERDSGRSREIEARYVVVADGANSRFGRALGAERDRSFPQGMAIRGYFASPRHDEPWIESHLDIHDSDGHVVPGYGWIFPVGDGRVNVGVGLLSSFHRWKSVNTSALMEAFVGFAPRSWDIRPETACGPPTGGRLPMGLSVRPRSGRTHLVVGDAGGSINPFNGEGIAYAYETGRMAALAVGQALASGNAGALSTYESRVSEQYEDYFKVARAFVRLIGRPEVMKVVGATGMRSRNVMGWVLRIMANLVRPDEVGPAEAAYRAATAVARLSPPRLSLARLSAPRPH